jgi:UDP-N-acetylmuramate--alanine ligase
MSEATLKITPGVAYHFIGIGGIGMSGLAELLVRQGARVSGSDLAAHAQTRRLQDLGATVYQGHDAAHLGDAAIVVHTTAAPPDNPELAAARAQGLTVLRRGEMLARLMQGYTQIAITGMHGKTSTTAMAGAILRAGGMDPTVVVGSVWGAVGSNAVLGDGRYFVAESDESDGSFALLSPEITVITNLDREHLDFYRDMAHIQQVFADYLARLPAGARLAAWADDPHLKPLLHAARRPTLTYSLNPGADFQATDLQVQGLGSRFRLHFQGRELGDITLPLAGPHYVLNAMAACAVGQLVGLDFAAWRQGLAHLGQIQRRCQVKGEVNGVMVMDDYGHHPAEIAATLAGLAQAFPERRLVVAFQPHRFTRTKALLPEFFPVFGDAGLLFLTDIYSAGEPAAPGLSGRTVYDGIRQSGHGAAHFVPDRAAMAAALAPHLNHGDLVLTLGAGDIWKTGEELLELLATVPPGPLAQP